MTMAVTGLRAQGALGPDLTLRRTADRLWWYAAAAEDPAAPPRHNLPAACRCRLRQARPAAPCRRWPHRYLPRQRGQRPGPSPLWPESRLPGWHLEPDGLPRLRDWRSVPGFRLDVVATM